MAQAHQAKQALRLSMLTARKALTPDEIHTASQAITQKISALDAWQQAQTVLSYMPTNGEVDVRVLLEDLWAKGTQVLLPRCRQDEPGVMETACTTCPDDLCPGAYGILEPSPSSCPCVDTIPDLVLIPGVAFDRRGYRLGMGGGFYDRFLSKLPSRTMLVAPAYGFQIKDKIPVQEWDIPVHVVITEHETIWT